MRKLWHNATKRTPEKEARLLWFANTQTPGNGDKDENNEEGQEQTDTGMNHSYSFDTNSVQIDPTLTQGTRQQAQAALGNPAHAHTVDTNGNTTTNTDSSKEEGKEEKEDKKKKKETEEERKKREADEKKKKEDDEKKKKAEEEEAERLRKEAEKVAARESEEAALKTADILKKIDKFYREYKNMLGEVKDFETFLNQVPIQKLIKNPEDADAYKDLKKMLQVEQQIALLWTTIKNDMKQWNTGEMHPDAFLNLIKDITLQTNKITGEVEPFPEEVKKVEEYIKLQHDQIAEFKTLKYMQETEDVIKAWSSENMSPTIFFNSIAKYLIENGFENGPAIISEMDGYMSNHHELIQLWELGGIEAIGVSDRITIIRDMLRISRADSILVEIRKNKKIIGDINRIVDMDGFLQDILGEVSGRKDSFDDLKVKLEKKADAERDEEHGGHTDNHGHGFRLLDVFGVEFYSFNQFFAAIKEVKEAYMEAWHSHEHHKVTRLASGLGTTLRILPNGNAAIVALEKRAISSDDKQKGEYADMLKSRHPDVDHLLLNEDSFINQAEKSHDPNFARAVLEYAADKGWLYDLDKNAQRNKRETMGKDINHLLHDWDETRIKDYYHSLRGKNQAGLEGEIKHAHDSVQNISNVPFFIQEIDHQFHEKNLWGVVGIGQRAMERGLEAEVGPWITTRVMRFARENPAIMQKISSDAFWDKLGALFLYHTASTEGLFKVQRKALDAQAERGDMANLENAGVLGNIILRAEKHIKERSGLTFETDEEKAKLDRLVAKLLAGQIVEIKDEHENVRAVVSIFEDEFEDYASKEKGQGEVHPEKEDEDYYRGISDNILADTVVVKAILDLTGSGTFKTEKRAIAYLGNILEMPKKLEDSGLPEAAANFRRITGEKLTEYLSGWLKDSRSEPLTNAKIKGKPLAALLITKGFVSKQLIIDALTQSWGNDKLARAILRDIDPKHPLVKGNEKKMAA